MKRILVTGAAGFIGRHCLAPLAARGFEIHAVSRNPPTTVSSAEVWHKGDLFDDAQVAALIAGVRPNHLLHLAWDTTPGKYRTSPDNRRWLEQSLKLVREFAAHGGSRAVLAGTCAEYEPSDDPCEEFQTPLSSSVAYSAAKNELHTACRALLPEISLAWCRLFFLFGPGEDSRRFVPQIFAALAEGRTARASHGRQLRDFLHVVDAAEALAAIVDHEISGPVNIASGRAVTIADVVNGIADVFGRRDLIHFGAISSDSAEPRAIVADVSRLRDELGWSPRFDLSSGLADFYAREWAAYAKERSAETMPDEQVCCPVCRSSATVEFLRRSQVPTNQNRALPDAESARSMTRGELRVRSCTKCGFVFNSAFDPERVFYDASYDNCQTVSPHFADHVERLAKRLTDECGVRNCRIVEVGCGQGAFVERLVSDPALGNRGRGFDPSYNGELSRCDGRLTFERRFYDAECATIEADVVVCRHVIEHVPDPVGLLKTIRAALSNSPGARLFFETPTVAWIFKHSVIWDFFYEHCSYFTAESLKTCFELAGFRVAQVGPIFGGQYLWLEAVLEPEAPEVTFNPTDIASLAERFGEFERNAVRDWTQAIKIHSRTGAVAIWGAGAKGGTFANLVDPRGELISCVVDINAAKQGRYIPGSRHLVISPDELESRGVMKVLVTNPNYTDEITTAVAGRTPAITVVDLMKSERAAA